MKLSEYVNSSKITLEAFLSLTEEEATRFDFLTQGEEADRTDLTKEIYTEIFPWYNSDEHAGDTLNTYRTAINKYYGDYYRFLSRETQLEIIGIIKASTPHEEGHLFEFEDIDKYGKPFFQICNNYQLGNFAILPTRGGINPKRAHDPYLDFVDDFLYTVNSFYEEEMTDDDELKQAILIQKNYFKQFETFGGFIHDNLFLSFFAEDEEGDVVYRNLSDLDSFEEYVEQVTGIISRRGRVIWQILQGEIDSDEGFVSYQEEFAEGTKASGKGLSVDEETAKKMTEVREYRDYLWADHQLYVDYSDRIDQTNQIYLQKSQAESEKQLQKKMAWTRWWHWLILFIGLCLVSGLLFNWLNQIAIDTTDTFEELFKKQRFISGIKMVFFVPFWLALIAKITYNIRFFKKDSEFEGEKNKRIAKMQADLDETVDALKADYYRDQVLLEKNSAEAIQSGMSLPESYRNLSDVTLLVSYLSDGRADNFKEAYELLENYKHRERLEEQARIATAATQEAAQRSIDSANRQARETERHNREVESHQREMEDRLRRH